MKSLHSLPHALMKQHGICIIPYTKLSTCQTQAQQWLCSYQQSLGRSVLTGDQFEAFRPLSADISNSLKSTRGSCPALLKSMCLCSLHLMTSLTGNTISDALFIYQSTAIPFTDKTELWLRSTNCTLMESGHSLQAEKWTAPLPVCWTTATLNLVCVREKESKRDLVRVLLPPAEL